MNQGAEWVKVTVLVFRGASLFRDEDSVLL